MVDGAVLLVDANEGPLQQTKFVVEKALKAGIRPLVVLNKVWRMCMQPTFQYLQGTTAYFLQGAAVTWERCDVNVCGECRWTGQAPPKTDAGRWRATSSTCLHRWVPQRSSWISKSCTPLHERYSSSACHIKLMSAAAFMG